ncbi:S24 family peptidase [Synergistes jonesii]|uniref:S24 family peptidase n=1 Tax=Synergistes jonesii TaxID=2754 RepID=UPI00248EB767|nr:S24 family peptidase [Synergistes jonesii]
MDTQQKRLYQARKKVGLTQKQAADLAGLSLRGYVRYELEDDNNKREIPAKVLTVYAQKGININWLLTGNGEMSLSALDGDADSGAPHRLSNGLLAVGDTIFVPLSPVKACCGAGFTVYPADYSLDETVAVKRGDVGQLVEGQLPYAVETEGRSMEGYGIPQGSTVIVNPAESISSGDVIMIIVDEKAAIKKLFVKPDGEEFVASGGERIYATRAELEEGYYVRKCGKVMLVISPPEHGV